MSYEKIADELKDKAIYNGTDARKDIYQVEEPTYRDADAIKKNSESVACMVKENKLVKVRGNYELSVNGKSTLSESIHSKYHFHYGENEPFGDQPVLGFGTAFLIAPQLVATAAHCVYNEEKNARVKISSLRFVFDFKLSEKGKFTQKFNMSQVYSGQDIVACEFGALTVKSGSHSDDYIPGSERDWAVVRLDRLVENREPLKIEWKSEIPNDTALYVLGFPSGLPMKFTCNAQVRNNDHENYFEADLDTFAGNSGSPVFNRDTHSVCGILVRGKEDYKVTDNYNNKNIKRVALVRHDGSGGYEHCQRITNLDSNKKLFSALNTEELKESRQAEKPTSENSSTESTRSLSHNSEEDLPQVSENTSYREPKRPFSFWDDPIWNDPMTLAGLLPPAAPFCLLWMAFRGAPKVIYTGGKVGRVVDGEWVPNEKEVAAKTTSPSM